MRRLNDALLCSRQYSYLISLSMLKCLWKVQCPDKKFCEYLTCLQILLYLFTDYIKECLFSPSKLPPKFLHSILYAGSKKKISNISTSHSCWCNFINLILFSSDLSQDTLLWQYKHAIIMCHYQIKAYIIIKIITCLIQVQLNSWLQDLMFWVLS